MRLPNGSPEALVRPKAAAFQPGEGDEAVTTYMEKPQDPTPATVASLSRK